jgi:hypothetical protein
MFQYLRSLAKRLMNKPGESGSPADPLAPVRQPRSRAPGGRSSAVAVEEPREWESVAARGDDVQRHR